MNDTNFIGWFDLQDNTNSEWPKEFKVLEHAFCRGVSLFVPGIIRLENQAGCWLKGSKLLSIVSGFGKFCGFSHLQAILAKPYVIGSSLRPLKLVAPGQIAISNSRQSRKFLPYIHFFTSDKGENIWQMDFQSVEVGIDASFVLLTMDCYLNCGDF